MLASFDLPRATIIHFLRRGAAGPLTISHEVFVIQPTEFLIKVVQVPKVYLAVLYRLDRV